MKSIAFQTRFRTLGLQRMKELQTLLDIHTFWRAEASINLIHFINAVQSKIVSSASQMTLQVNVTYCRKYYLSQELSLCRMCCVCLF